jgi:hypothetical protein
VRRDVAAARIVARGGVDCFSDLFAIHDHR